MSEHGPITIIDYGLGNLYSVQHALHVVGASARISSDPSDIVAARGLVLPGVGAFGVAMENLRSRGLLEPLVRAVRSGVPCFGICLGMQLLFSVSEEFGDHQGLAVCSGRVVPFTRGTATPAGVPMKIPHVGWNRVSFVRDEHHAPRDIPSPFDGIGDDAFCYFVHSFYTIPNDSGIVAAYAEYAGVRFCAAIARDHLFATQFHPERSGALGLHILNQFVAHVQSL